MLETISEWRANVFDDDLFHVKLIWVKQARLFDDEYKFNFYIEMT